MKKSIFTIAILASAATMHSCNNSSSHKEEPMDTIATDTTITKAPATSSTLSDEDKRFATEAAIYGLMEVELGKLAAAKGLNGDVKKIGQKMVEDYGMANANLQSIAAAKYLKLPTTLPMEAQSRIDEMGKLKGVDFDKSYLAAKAKDYGGTLKTFQDEAASGQDTDIKAFAAKTVQLLKRHNAWIKGMGMDRQ